MAIERNILGPLKYANLYQINECSFFDKTRPPKIEARDDDEDYIVKIDDRLDILAFNKYADSSLDWIIMTRNDMFIWPDDMVPGRVIKIPTMVSLRERKII